MFFIPNIETGEIEISSPIGAEGDNLIRSGLPPHSPFKRALRRSVSRAALRPNKYTHWSVTVPDIAYVQEIAICLVAAAKENVQKGRVNAAGCIGELACQTIDFIVTQPPLPLPEDIVIPDDLSGLPPLPPSPPDDWASF